MSQKRSDNYHTGGYTETHFVSITRHFAEQAARTCAQSQAQHPTPFAAQVFETVDGTFACASAGFSPSSVLWTLSKSVVGEAAHSEITACCSDVNKREVNSAKRNRLKRERHSLEKGVDYLSE
jgi:hypothetical protein